MIAYLTVADQPSGIYSSQVIDNCRLLSTITNSKVRLIALISVREFRANKAKIKAQYKDAVVLPMFPRLSNWQINQVLLFFIFLVYRSKIVICRNAIPTVLALKLKKLNLVRFVIYDGRGAEYEQFVEYDMISDERMKMEMKECERKAVNFSDHQLAVSNALIRYWRDVYGYDKSTNTVIPCTFNAWHGKEQLKNITRQHLGFTIDDIVLVFSGSSSKWQSFDLMFEFLTKQLQENSLTKVLLMTRQTREINDFALKYKDRVVIKWCQESEVNAYLSLADYGLLFREGSITNKVSSPIKFAEYLNAGLNVIISDGVGDLSLFVKEHHCGIVMNQQPVHLSPLSASQRNLNKQLAVTYFSKGSDLIKEKFAFVLNQSRHVS